MVETIFLGTYVFNTPTLGQTYSTNLFITYCVYKLFHRYGNYLTSSLYSACQLYKKGYETGLYLCSHLCKG